MTDKLQVAFDDLPINAGKTTTQRREYWEKSRRLQHGTLVALWWEQPSQKPTSSNDSSAPCITFATISMRNEQQLAPRESGANPQLGVRYSSFAAKTPVALGLLPGKACCCKHVHAPSRTHAFALGHHCALSTCILADAPGSRCISQAGPDCTPLCLQHLIS